MLYIDFTTRNKIMFGQKNQELTTSCFIGGSCGVAA